MTNSAEKEARLYSAIPPELEGVKLLLDGKRPTDVLIYLYHAKSRGYIISISNVHRSMERGFACESSDLDFSGKNQVYVCDAGRFSAKTLAAIRAAISPHVKEIAETWLKEGMSDKLSSSIRQWAEVR